MSLHKNRGIAMPTVIIVLLLTASAAGWILYFKNQQTLEKMGETEAALAEEKDSNAQLETSLTALKSSQVEAHGHIETLTDEVKRLKKTADENSRMQAALDKTYAVVAALTDERDAAQQQIAGFAAERDDINQLLEQLGKERDTASQQVAQLEQAHAEINQQVVELITARDTAQASDQRGREQLAELVAQMETSQQDSETYRSQLDAARNELDSSAAQTDSLNQRIAALEAEREKERQAFAELQQQLDAELGKNSVDIEQNTGQPTVIRLRGDVLFGSGSAALLGSARKALNQVGKVLDNYPERPIQVEGHTDNIPISGGTRFASNWELSAARASSAVRYLIDNTAISPQRLRVTGLAEYSPIDDNSNAEGRARNRRIEIKLLPADGFVEVAPGDTN